ncbi:hypothetical protein C8R44DRAFT_778592 [Mycena epipterygia]|nr:hypothetical protein C8R44DRAFT_778592 [Mycena epipterygia]
MRHQHTAYVSTSPPWLNQALDFPLIADLSLRVEKLANILFSSSKLESCTTSTWFFDDSGFRISRNRPFKFRRIQYSVSIHSRS